LEENKVEKDLDEEIKDEEVDVKEEPQKEEKTEEEPKTETKKEKKDKHKSEIAKLEAKLKEADLKYAELKNEYLKVFAEMENTKKRLKEEAIKDRKYASQSVIGELVTPIDMFVKIVNMESSNPEVKNYQIGFQMIANQIVDIMKREGLSHIESLNKEFDPKVMQAVQTEWDETKPENSVLRVMQDGYMYKDRVLKPAMVVVNKKTEEKNEEKKEEE